MSAELPTITSSGYVSTAVDPANAIISGPSPAWERLGAGLVDSGLILRGAGGLPAAMDGPLKDALNRITNPKEPQVANPKARVVKVLIADNNENLPLEKRLLFSGQEQFTDATDQELFYELSIQALLAEHNALRAKTLDKAATAKAGRDVFLEPIRVRDLSMVVVTVASFA